MANGTQSRVALALSLTAWAGAVAAAEPQAVADDRTLVALAVALACADAPPRPSGKAPPGDASGAVELVARVRARALSFVEVPRLETILPLDLARRVGWTAERVNLPARPEAGVVYEDVEVRLTIRAAPDDLAAVLAAARRASTAVVVVPRPRR
jgi:hypothetical protein